MNAVAQPSNPEASTVFNERTGSSKLKKIITEPMSDADIELYLPSAKVLMFRELKGYPNIQAILKRPRDYFIMLYEHTPQNGHWTAALRYGNTIEFFCPYGTSPYSPNSPLEWNSPDQNAAVDATSNYLETMLNQAEKDGFKVIFNKMDLQSKDNDINTCGSFVVFRILCLMEDDFSLSAFQKAIKKIHNATGLNYDEIAADAIEVRE